MRQAQRDCTPLSSGFVGADHIARLPPLEQRLRRQMRMPLPYNQAARVAQLTRI